MGTLDVLEQTASQAERAPDEIVNDFSIVVATVNGSGSQTANGLLARAAFKMGVPVSAKNLFPSN
ncbi:MAG TPA: 2-oxoacid:acceptor oxidoreductase subunit alpha, partial [Chloroflexia bacterium]